jgi:hypothetical protein
VIAEDPGGAESHFERRIARRERALVEGCRAFDLAHLVNEHGHVQGLIGRRAVVGVVQLRPLLQKVAPRAQVEVHVGSDRVSTVIAMVSVPATAVGMTNRLGVGDGKVGELFLEIARDHRRHHHATRRAAHRRQHDDAAKQAAVDAFGDVARMVMEGPGAEHLVGDGVVIDPMLARADFVGAAAVGALGTEGPGAVRIDAVAQAMHMETVRHGVGVHHLDVQVVAWVRIDHGARHAVCKDRLVHIDQDEFVGLGDQVGGVEVLAVDQGVEAARVHLGERNHAVLVARVAHAVAPVVRRGMTAGFNRAVVEDLLDLQVDISNRHGQYPI